MLKFSGKSVYKGIAMGKVLVLKKNDSPVVRGRIEDADAEMFLFIHLHRLAGT